MVKAITTDKAPAAIGPYVQAVDMGNLLFLSGQLPIDIATGTMPDNIEDQTKFSLANIKAVLAAANCQPSSIVKVTIFLADLNDFVPMNTVYEQFFKDNNAPFPARSCVQVARIPKDAKIEIEVIAAK